MVARCQWCTDDPLYVDYHDNEWGVPVYDDRSLFEMLILEGVQAGLSWLTVLKKRPNYRQAFMQFDPQKIADFTEEDIARLMQDSGIIRNRLKIEATIRNARSYLQAIEERGSFSDYIWAFVDGKTIINNWKSIDDIPAFTKESAAMSKDLKKRNFNFVGPTICYAFMQAVGMVNDHTTDCFRYDELK